MMKKSCAANPSRLKSKCALLIRELKSNDEAPEVIGSNSPQVLVPAQELAKVADAGGNPADRLGAFPLSPGTNTISCQRIRECGQLALLLLTA